MKFGTRILDTKLQNGIENQPITIQESVCKIDLCITYRFLRIPIWSSAAKGTLTRIACIQSHRALANYTISTPKKR